MKNTLKTIYVSLHDGQNYGETPIVEMRIHRQENISHGELIALRYRLERFIDGEIEYIKRTRSET